MYCLLCGKTLAIFRKSSIGDFCCPEHRVAYLTQQANLSLARLVERATVAPEAEEAVPVGPSEASYARAELDAAVNSVAPIDTGPLYLPGPLMPAPLPPGPALNETAPAGAVRPLERLPDSVPLEMPVRGFHLQPARFDPLLNGGLALRTAGLLAPWSVGCEESLSLSPLMAAAFARPGNCAPRVPRYGFEVTIEAAWPRPGAAEPDLLWRVAEAGVEDESEDEQAGSAAETIPSPPVSAPPPKQPTAFDLTEGSEPKPAYTSRTPRLSASERWEVYLRSQTDELSSGSEPVEPELPPPPPSRVVEARPEAMPPVAPDWKLPSTLIPAVKVPPSQRSSRSYDDEEQGHGQPRGPMGSRASNLRFPMPFSMPSAGAIGAALALTFVILTMGAFLSIPTASRTGSSPGGSGSPISLRLDSLRLTLRSRAAIRLYDDFRAGLAGWDGPEGWAKDWSYDQAGFVRPGGFAVLRQSKNLANYRMEFLGQIERKSLGWVFRAADPNNYYAAKITITKPGPLPFADLVHYAVTNGKPGPSVSRPLPFSVRNDTLYQVQMDVRKDEFTARVNGTLVDFWIDRTLTAGGVGFLSEAGEQARVRWLRVSDRDDFVGRVCSFLSARNLVPQLPGDVTLSASAYLNPLEPSF